MTREEALGILAMFLHKQCDLERTKFTYDANTVWDAVKMAEEALEGQNDGEWIPVTNGRGGHECSKCHSYAPSYQSGDEMLANFCPHCGAKMGVEDE